MATAIDNIRDSWEQKTPSEQRLLVILGVVLVSLVLFVMVSQIQSGMSEIESDNENAREALRTLAVYRQAKAKAKASGDVGSNVKIPEEALALDSYLDGILKEMSISAPTYPESRENPVGNFVELSFEIQLKGLNIGEITELLERLETGSKLVVVKELNIDRNFKDKERLDLKVTLATYKKKETKSNKASSGEKKEEGS